VSDAPFRRDLGELEAGKLVKVGTNTMYLVVSELSEEELQAALGSLILTGEGEKNPDAADCPSSRWIAWFRTDKRVPSLWYNDSGTMRQA
jgi:hypothetical protein